MASVEGQPGYRATTSKFSRTLASRPIRSVTASRFWPGAKKKSQGVGCISAHLARSGCRGFAPAALAREASPRRDANTERKPRNRLGIKEIFGKKTRRLPARALLARSGCRGFAPAALAREAFPRNDAKLMPKLEAHDEKSWKKDTTPRRGTAQAERQTNKQTDRNKQNQTERQPDRHETD